MKEFAKELEQLPQERQKAIKEGLQRKIIAQAVIVRDEQPTKFLAYIDEEIKDADASMLEMVQESSREGAEFGAISEIYIWNKERKKALARLRDEMQAAPEPQNKDLHYYCQKAIEKGYMVKVTDGYRITKEWTKALLAYFLKHFLNTDGTFPDKKYCLMFGESRLSKSADQLSMNKNGGGKPRGYEMVEELLQE